MSEMFNLMFDWPELMDRGADATVYMVMALAGSALFLVRLGFALFGGGDSDFDTDIDAGVDTDVSFNFFSLLSILAFFMGAGWMGLACRLDWSMGPVTSGFIAAGFGFAMMASASALAYGTRRLNKQIDYDVKTAVGRSARAYLTIPAKGKGAGQVQVSVSGRSKIMRALSSGPEIPAFTDVMVVDVEDDDSLVVQPKS